jgi:hypothetical protein
MGPTPTQPLIPPQMFACPHCGASNPAGSTFCGACGKALPATAPTGPRLVTGDALAATAAGVKLQSDALHKEAKKAAGALLAVAIIQTLATIVVGFLVYQRGGRAGAGTGGAAGQFVLEPYAVIIVGIIAVLFWGLYFWARVQPLPAAIVGLVIYCTFKAVDVVAALMLMAEGGRRGGFGGLGIGCIDIIIIVVLAQAVSAGVKHRRLVRATAAAAPPMAWPPPGAMPPPR